MAFGAGLADQIILYFVVSGASPYPTKSVHRLVTNNTDDRAYEVDRDNPRAAYREGLGGYPG